MRKEIKEAYRSVQPDEAVLEDILGRVQKTGKPRRSRKLGQVLAAAACLAIAAALSLGGFAAYERWRLPKPEVYEPTPNGGVLDIHSTEVYTAPVETGTDQETAQNEQPDSTSQPAPESGYSDSFFMTRAAEVLEQAGLTDVDQSRMTVTRQENLFWSREEAAVVYDLDDCRTEVTFDAKSGYLVHISSIDWDETREEAVCKTLQEAIDLARVYYEALPVPQGYTYTGCTEYDEQYWSLEFCHELENGLVNQYEMVRIALNPITGRLEGLNVFNVPLLDDHGPDDIPLTQAEAEAAAENCPSVNLEGKVLRSAEIQIVLPNWWFTDYFSDAGNARASDVTRLAWSLVYENPDSWYADELWIDVDLYTGEILGGSAT